MTSIKIQNGDNNMKYIQIILLAGSLALAGSAYAHEDHNQGVSFEAPKNGVLVSQTFKVEMKVKGMKVHKAGTPVEGTGHFHIIIDGGCVKQGTAVAKDPTHIHFGKGQKETYISLKPGAHTLSLQFADGHHISYGKDWCKTIHITVKSRR